MKRLLIPLVLVSLLLVGCDSPGHEYVNLSEYVLKEEALDYTIEEFSLWDIIDAYKEKYGDGAYWEYFGEHYSIETLALESGIPALYSITEEAYLDALDGDSTGFDWLKNNYDLDEYFGDYVGDTSTMRLHATNGNHFDDIAIKDIAFNMEPESLNEYSRCKCLIDNGVEVPEIDATSAEEDIKAESAGTEGEEQMSAPAVEYDDSLLTDTDSNLIKGYYYDTDASILYIRLRTGYLYAYYAVPPAIVDDLAKAESKGAYYRTSIANSYKYACIEQGPEDYQFNILPDATNATFIVNVSSTKFHTLTCSETEELTKNMRYTDASYEELIGWEYVPCKKCNPSPDSTEDITNSAKVEEKDNSKSAKEDKKEAIEDYGFHVLSGPADAKYVVDTYNRLIHTLSCDLYSHGSNTRFTDTAYARLIYLKYKPCEKCMPEKQ
ncbi:MAG: KTSC domain-containing protein [Butyrivibrio sp.]|nr:KTSC domain-containing protein [Butyrivibrio sp.]